MNTVTADAVDLAEENRRLREQLEQKTRVAAKALAAQQRRVLEMEEYAADLAAANERVSQANASLAAALRVLEEKDRRLSEDLAQARSFQQRILPRPPAGGRLGFAIAYRPAEEVGGDLYSVSALPGGGWRVFIADAIGHGVQAALRTMILKSEYDAVRDAATPREVLARLNRQIVAVYPGLDLHCTAACIDVAPEAYGARVTYATAAHPPLVHVSAGDALQLYQPGPFLGVVAEAEFPSMTLAARPGDRLFLFSDGLVEEWAGDEEFGVDRVLRALVAAGDLDATVRGAVDALEAFVGAQPVTDDVTLLGVEVTR
ncbi:MAG: SpoIIE family protein phosphatase [Deltaproteobacteria bacterium]|nr:SpoIIE family protein phosphatase [Myxococcales bacterium]MDP3216063.1 SpoIIE family protein phosphatase [Deltaproteobacteria bacterium]